MKSRNLLASETNLMNAKMMQNMLECTTYVGHHIKRQNSRRAISAVLLAHGPDLETEEYSRFRYFQVYS